MSTDSITMYNAMDTVRSHGMQFEALVNKFLYAVMVCKLKL